MSRRRSSGPSVSEAELDELGESLFNRPLNSLMQDMTESPTTNQGEKSRAKAYAQVRPGKKVTEEQQPGKHRASKRERTTPPTSPIRAGSSEELYREGCALREKDPKRAATLVKMAAENGLSQAMNAMGEYYGKGVGVPMDPCTAVAWYRKAVKKGSLEGMANLGMAYLEGTGVAQDKKKGLELFKRAAERGGEEGLRNLAYCYQYGVGVPEDLEESKRLMSSANEAARVKYAARRQRPGRVRRSRLRVAAEEQNSITERGPSAAVSSPLARDREDDRRKIEHETNTALMRIRTLSSYKQDRAETLIADIRPIEAFTRTSVNARVLVLNQSGHLKIMPALAAFRDDVRVQDLGIRILRNLVIGIPGEDVRLRAYLLPDTLTRRAKGASKGTAKHYEATTVSPIEFIIMIMQRHINVKAIQAVGCSALAEFATVSLLVKETIREQNGVETVVKAMVSHPRVAIVQQRGSRAICNICVSADMNMKRSVGLRGGIEPVLQAIRTFATSDTDANASVVETACSALRNICSGCESNGKIVIKRGGVGAVLSAIRLFIRREPVVGWGLASLGVLTGSGETLWREGAVQVIGLVLQRWSGIPGIVVSMLAILASMASVGGNIQHEVGSEHIESVINVMRRFSTDKKIIENGCTCLSEMCLGDLENQALARKKGGPAVVVDALKGYNDHAGIVECSSTAIYAMCGGDPESRTLVINRQGIEAVVDGLRRFGRNSPGVVEGAAAALRVLSEQSVNSQGKINELRGVDLLLTAMKTYPNSSGVLEQCAGGIAVLGHENEVLKARLAEDGAVATLIASMKRFSNNPFVVEQCCRAVQCLSKKNAGISMSFVTRGIGELLAKALNQYARDLSENGEAAESICETFVTLGCEHASHKDILGQEGAIAELVETIRDGSKGHKKPLLAALSALRILTSDSQTNQDRLGLCGGIGVVVNTLNMNEKSPQIAESCCRALYTASLHHNDNTDNTLQSNGIEAIVLAVRRFRSDKFLVAALSALYILISDSETGQDKLSRCGGVAAVVNTLKLNKKSPQVAELCCLALCNASRRHDRNRDSILESSGIEAIVSAMRRFRKEEYVAVQGCWALAVACVNNPELQKRVAKNKAIGVVVDIMNAFSKSADVQAAACAFMFSFAVGNKANQRRVALQDGRSVIARAIAQHPAHRKVVRYGNEALRVTEDVRLGDPYPGSERRLVRTQSYGGPRKEARESQNDEHPETVSDGASGRKTESWRRRSKSSPTAPLSRWNTVKSRFRSFTLVSRALSNRKNGKDRLTERTIEEINREKTNSGSEETEDENDLV